MIVSPSNTVFQPSQTYIKENKYWQCGMLGPAMLGVRSFSSNSGHMNVLPSQSRRSFFLKQIVENNLVYHAIGVEHGHTW